jgi:Short C-terminal domain/Protein of unknown function (DUF2510)
MARWGNGSNEALEAAVPLAPGVPAGWYPDPLGGVARYWDGSRWSKRYRDAPPLEPVPNGSSPLADGPTERVPADPIARAAEVERLRFPPPPTARARKPPEPNRSSVRGLARSTPAEPKPNAPASGTPRKTKPDAKFSPGFSSIKLYGDRIESKWGSGSIAGATARVDATGSKRLVRDTRQLFLTIEGPDISVAVKVGSNNALVHKAAREFAAKVNSKAMQLRQRAEVNTPQVDVLEQLERLGRLRDSGVITEDEFASQKARLLGSEG